MESTIDLVKKAWAHASSLQASLLAAGVAFYVFLAIFPALIAGVLTYGLVVSPETLARQSQQIADALPADAASLITGQLDSLAQTSNGSLGFGLVLSIVLAMYSASGGVANLLVALTRVFGGDSDRNFVQAKLQALTLTIGGVVFALVMITLVAAAPVLFDQLALPGFVRAVLELARWLLLVGALIVAVTVLFRSADHRTDGTRHSRQLKLGVLVAAGLWLAVSLGFSLYVDNFGSYGKTYGALAGVVALLLWLWIGMFALLLGASVEAVTEREAVTPGRPTTGLSRATDPARKPPPPRRPREESGRRRFLGGGDR